MIDKIKKELKKRFEISDSNMIEIVMKKSGDTIIITADSDVKDPGTVFELKSFKLQPVRVEGLDRLAAEIANYDQAVAEQQDAIADLYAFKREKIDTGMASASEKAWYISAFENMFGYRPSVAA